MNSSKKAKENKSGDEFFIKGIKWLVILALVFVAVYLIMEFVVSPLTQELRTVEYGNLTFTKTKFGEIPVYYYWYNFKGPSGEINRYNLYLRINPSKNDVLVTGEIEYQKVGRTIYSSINESSLIGCTNANRELTTLGMFVLGQKYKFEQTYLDNETALLRGGKFVNCESKPNNMVLEITRTNRTIIEKVNENCYKLEFETCEKFLNVVEKFEVETFVDAKNRTLYG